MKAFYFAPNDKKLRYGDNRQIRVGRTHKVSGTPKLCKHGLHASVRLIDALGYAPGHHLYMVKLDGEMDVGNDKVAAQERTYIAHFNAEKLLREFARKQALINIEKIKPFISDDEYDVICRWLGTGDVKLQSAARSAAWSAAMAAARSAEESAARSAAWSALSAADSAAESAESAARSAEESAA